MMDIDRTALVLLFMFLPAFCMVAYVLIDFGVDMMREFRSAISKRAWTTVVVMSLFALWLVILIPLIVWEVRSS